MLYKYSREVIDDDLDNRIVRSKKQFKYEESFLSEEERRLRRFGELAIGVNSEFSKYVETVEPKDCDFNYEKV